MKKKSMEPAENQQGVCPPKKKGGNKINAFPCYCRFLRTSNRRRCTEERADKRTKNKALQAVVTTRLCALFSCFERRDNEEGDFLLALVAHTQTWHFFCSSRTDSTREENERRQVNIPGKGRDRSTESWLFLCLCSLDLF